MPALPLGKKASMLGYDGHSSRRVSLDQPPASAQLSTRDGSLAATTAAAVKEYQVKSLMP